MIRREEVNYRERKQAKMDRLSSVLLAKNSFFKHIIVSKHQIISLVKRCDPLKSYYNFSHSNILALKIL